MILDQNLTLVNSAESVRGADKLLGDVLDLRGAGSQVSQPWGLGKPLYMIVQVTDAFAGGTSAAFALRGNGVLTSGDLRAAGQVVLSQGPVIPVARLTADSLHVLTLEQSVDWPRYVQAYVDVAGTFTAGAVRAFISMDADVRRAYVDARN